MFHIGFIYTLSCAEHQLEHHPAATYLHVYSCFKAIKGIGRLFFLSDFSLPFFFPFFFLSACLITVQLLILFTRNLQNSKKGGADAYSASTYSENRGWGWLGDHADIHNCWRISPFPCCLFFVYVCVARE